MSLRQVSHEPAGDSVICDVCGVDYTQSKESGGFIFGSYGYCPACANKGLAKIQEYNEEDYIKARCPEGVSFADFVRAYRGPNAGRTIFQFDTVEDVFEALGGS